MWNVWLPIAQTHMNLFFLSGFGLGIGFLAGFFGVGGGFIMTPLLMAAGIPPAVAVGSGLAIMLGASISGTLRHIQLGNVDFKLALILLIGTTAGVQAGALSLEFLENCQTLRLGGLAVEATHFCLGLCYMAILYSVGVLMILGSNRPVKGTSHDSIKAVMAQRLQAMPLPPFVSLPASGINRYPLFVLLAIGVFVGLLAGLLGVGGGMVMLPTMIYLIGLKAQRAVGTDLCQVSATAAVGTVVHALHGNVDPILAAIVLVTAIVGARLGASATNRVGGLRLRRYFGFFAIATGIAVTFFFLRKTFFLG